MFTSSDKKTKLTGYGKHILLLFFKDFTQYFSLEQIRRFYSVVIVQVIDLLGMYSLLTRPVTAVCASESAEYFDLKFARK